MKLKLKFLIQFFKYLAFAFLFFAIGKFIAVLVDVFYLNDPLVIPRYTSTFITPQDKSTPIKEYKELVMGNLLNTEAAPPGILDEDIVRSDIDSVELTGVLAWPGRSFAILSYNGVSSTVKQDDSIPSTSIKLVAVERNQVKLTNAGVERWVPIKRLGAPQVAGLSQPNQPPAGNPGQATGGVQILPMQGNNQDVLVSQARIESELKNFSQFLNQARVFPYFDNGTPAGYVIRNIEPGSFYEQLGLTNNDIIKTVNGQIIDSPDRAFELFKLLRNEKLVSMSIVRNSRTIDFKFHIN